VHYKGYNSKYDESLSTANTSRLAPLHTHTPRPASSHDVSAYLFVGAKLMVLDSLDSRLV
jgi:hypothetical protein